MLNWTPTCDLFVIRIWTKVKLVLVMVLTGAVNKMCVWTLRLILSVLCGSLYTVTATVSAPDPGYCLKVLIIFNVLQF